MMRRIVLLAALPSALLAQVNFDTITIRAQALRGGVYMLTGAGGNIGVSTGADATFLVDDQFAPLTPKIIAAVASITSKPIRFVVNTHWHGDHTGGNENIGKAGALIVAHQNVRKRMSTEQFIRLFNSRTPPAPAAALPVVTFTDSVSFHINGDELVAFYVPGAHTDSDALVHFTRADVLHMGDTYFEAWYPFIDLDSGGNVNGIIAAADRALGVCTPQTIVIPGHGPVSNCEKLRAYRNVVATVRDRVRAEMQRGRSLDQIKLAKVTAEFDAVYGKAFITPDMFVEFVYRSLGGR
jgi:cyclase